MFDENQIFPTEGALSLMRSRLISAQRCYVLMKKKADTLTTQFKAVLAKIIEKKFIIREVMTEASLSLAKLRYITGNINEFILQSANRATIQVLSRRTIIAGINIKNYEYHEEGLDTFVYIGLGRGGQQVLQVKNNYRKALEILITLASLQSNFIALIEHVRITNRRVNVLRFILIPRLKRTMKYIINELEEQEREEMFRMKKVQAWKRKKALKR